MFSCSWLNGSRLLGSFIHVPKDKELATNLPVPEKNSDEIVNEFELLGPPAYSLPLANLKYDKADKGLGTSAHRVIPGVDVTNNSNCYIKFNENKAMLYVESLMMHLYSSSLLYGVARSYVRTEENNGEPVANSSQELEGFDTFKHHKLSKQQIDDPVYRERLLRIIAVMDRMHEDDGHAGNVTNNPINLSHCLQLFDGDCAFWDATCEVKGPEVIDSTRLRDPKTAFRLSEENIKRFPNPIAVQARYRPGMDSKGPSTWSAADNELVRKLEGNPEALRISLLEYVDWMLDTSQRFPHLARLHIPAKLQIHGKMTGVDVNLMQFLCEKNAEIDKEYWEMLPKICEFQEFFHDSYLKIAQEILIRCMIRNQRLENDKKIHPYHDEEFDAAILDPHLVIAKLNELIKLTISKQVLAWSMLAEQQRSMLFATKRLETHAREIDATTAEFMIDNAKIIAHEMFELEKVYGLNKWDKFEEKRNEIKKNNIYYSTLEIF